MGFVMVNPKYNPYIAKFFSGPAIREMATTGKSFFISSLLKESQLINYLPKTFTYYEFFENVYYYLLRYYRSEYIYKNAIANKILLGKHSLNTSTLLSEFRVGKSKADVVILNGSSSVYEIKTEFDNFDRLKDQIQSYKDVFDEINVITNEDQLERLEGNIEKNIGILLLTDQYTIRNIRKPISNKINIKPGVIFDSLRKKEYCKIIIDEFGYLPKIPNTKLRTEAKKIFMQLRPEKAHDKMVEALRMRYQKKSFKDFVLSVPRSLVHASLASNLNNTQQNSFQKLLTSQFIQV